MKGFRNGQNIQQQNSTSGKTGHARESIFNRNYTFQSRVIPYHTSWWEHSLSRLSSDVQEGVYCINSKDLSKA